MHSCLTLVDYTWRDADESDLTSPTVQNSDTTRRWRRFTRSLDEHSTAENQLRDEGSRYMSRTSRSFQSDVNLGSRRAPFDSRHMPPESLLLLSSRQRPTYASSMRTVHSTHKIWAPVGHCCYLLNRDPRTGEIQWSPESNEIICSPRNLTEICLARLVRDWPCMLPPRQPSLRNVVNFLFSVRESRISEAPTSRQSSLAGRRAISMAAYVNSRTTSTSPGKKEGVTITATRNSGFPMNYYDLPISLLINLIREAILQRDCAAIAGLVATWPDTQMVIRRLIPPEEFPLSPSYLTKPSFVLVSPETGRANRTTLVKGPSLMDAFILGLLSRQPVCKLINLDFTGFENDQRLSIELSRLPILWMKPESRNSEYVRRHLMASLHVGIPRKRLEAYFSRIASIYAIHEPELGHGESHETVTIHLDCNMTVDEVALGLSLQWLTPFRFSCNRLLLQKLPELHFPPYSLIHLFDPLSITQFEMEDPSLGSSLAVVLPSAVGWLISLRNLRACSLPACIPPPPELVPMDTSGQGENVAVGRQARSGQSFRPITSYNSGPGANSQPSSAPVFTSTVAACRSLNRAMISLRYLQRLGLSRCHLTGNLKVLLQGLSQPLEYLNLQDCCLSAEDVHFLVYHWRPLQGLYELNLSRNNLSNVPDETLNQLIRSVCLRPPGQLVCLSIAYTCLSTDRLVHLVGLMAGMDGTQCTQPFTDVDDGSSDKWIDTTCTLRVLCIQPFVPPPREDIHRILYRVARLPKLQRLHLFPAAYAFPTHRDMSQRDMRVDWIAHCRAYLQQRFRPEIEVF